MTHSRIRRLVLSALFLALCLVLPFVTGQIPQYGSMLLPMHFPVLLCGFVCGGAMGALVGLIAPLMRFLLFGMPPIYPTAISMALELAAYGLLSGFLYGRLPRKPVYLYVSLIAAMLLGRAVWAGAQAALLSFRESAFTAKAFLAGAFVNAWPGIICQIALIPPLVLALSRAKLLPTDRKDGGR